MAKNNNLTDFMVSVANAIRTKKGTSGAINPQNFDSEILSIEGMPSSTKALANVISGEVATDETTLNNAIAKGATDTPETATFTERTTADGGTIKDTIARIDKVKGNCVKFNQLQKNSTYASGSSNGLEWVNNGDGSFTFNGTPTGNRSAWTSDDIPLIAGHKYLAMSGNSKVHAYTQYNFAHRTELLVTPTESGNYKFGLWTIANTTYTNDVARVQVFDLTAIGREDITTADGIAQHYGYADYASMPPMAYQSETIVLTNSQNSVTSKSANLWDEEYLLGYYNGNTGTFTQDTTGKYISSKNFIAVKANTTYKIVSHCATKRCLFYDSGKNFISYDAAINGLITIPSNCAYMQISCWTYGSTTYNNDIAIIEGTSGEYHPYFAPDNLPTNAGNLTDSEGSTIFPNGLCSVGDVHDEWDMAKGVAVKRVGVVDLGSFAWTYYTSGTNPIFYTEAKSIIPNTTANLVQPSIISNDYAQHANTTRSTFATNAADKRYGFMSADRRIQIRDTAYTSASAFKTAMSGVYLYYELAEPITYAVAPCKAYYKVSQNGKEIANSTELSAPFKADIAYRGMSAEELINELNG